MPKKSQYAFVAYQNGMLMPFTMRSTRGAVEHYMIQQYFYDHKPWVKRRREGWEIRRVKVEPVRAKSHA